MREKKERNALIMAAIENGEYLVDIAKKWSISAGMVSKIKRRKLKIKQGREQESGKIIIKKK